VGLNGCSIQPLEKILSERSTSSGELLFFVFISIWSVFFLRRPPGKVIGTKVTVSKGTDTRDGKSWMMVPLVMEKHMSPDQITTTFSPLFPSQVAHSKEESTLLAHS
jgi:hypothetical protein